MSLPPPYPDNPWSVGYTQTDPEPTKETKTTPAPEPKGNISQVHWTAEMDLTLMGLVYRGQTYEQIATVLRLHPRAVAYRHADLYELTRERSSAPAVQGPQVSNPTAIAAWMRYVGDNSIDTRGPFRLSPDSKFDLHAVQVLEVLVKKVTGADWLRTRDLVRQFTGRVYTTAEVMHKYHEAC
ncbi:hypothetical protein OQA88_3371 [Cercophora sp. LCS_1]